MFHLIRKPLHLFGKTLPFFRKSQQFRWEKIWTFLTDEELQKQLGKENSKLIVKEIAKLHAPTVQYDFENKGFFILNFTDSESNWKSCFLKPNWIGPCRIKSVKKITFKNKAKSLQEEKCQFNIQITGTRYEIACLLKSKELSLEMYKTLKRDKILKKNLNPRNGLIKSYNRSDYEMNFWVTTYFNENLLDQQKRGKIK